MILPNPFKRALRTLLPYADSQTTDWTLLKDDHRKVRTPYDLGNENQEMLHKLKRESAFSGSDRAIWQLKDEK